MSFTSAELDSYLEKHSVSESTAAYIREAAIGVSRNVGGTPFPAVVTEFQSDKTMVSVNTESHTGELAFAIHLDMDDDVVAYFEQLPPIDCLRSDKRGRQAHRAYRADYLVLHNTGPRVVQIKDADKAAALVSDNPTDWVRSGDHVVDLPALRAFETIGLRHDVVLSSDMPQVRVENLRTLSRVRFSVSEPDQAVVERVNNLLEQRSVIGLSDLMHELKLTAASPILKLVLNGTIFADLDHQLLTSPESCLLSCDKRILREVIDARLAVSYVAPQSGSGVEFAPTKEAAERALGRLALVDSSAKTRSVRRWRNLIRSNHGVSPFLIMLPKHHRSGNRLPKRPKGVLEFALEAIHKYWATKDRPSISNAHKSYRVEAQERHAGVEPLTLPTFSKLVQKHRQDLAEIRGGRRLANSLSSPSVVSKRAIRATRPFEYAQVDHNLAKIYCELFRTEKHTYVARPWLTVLRDVYTGEPLARWISFSKPSRLAVAMVIRSCLRRHGRLPETISVDKGGEFRSVYLSSLAAHYGFHLETRPSSHSRYGGPIERFFGMFRSLWLDRCTGNCTDIKDVRGVSGSHHPRNLKCMRLPDFLREFDAFSVWFIHEKLDRNLAPFVARKEGLERFPFSGIAVSYNDAFVIATAVDYGKLSIDESRGIKIKDEHYWHPELRKCALNGAVEVRLEPEDHTCIYVRSGDHWITAMSSRHTVLATETEEFRVAESLMVMDAKEQREKAKQNSNIRLVRMWKDADARFSYEPSTPSPNAEAVPEPEAEDVWSMIRSSAVEGLSTSAWGSPA